MATNNFSPVIEQFIDRLMEEKNLVNLSPDVSAQMKTDLAKKAEEKVKAAIFESIPVDKLEEFNQVMEKNDEVELQSFIKAQIPDLEEITARSLLDFRSTYLG